MRPLVLGTAGHIDHGKSALVEALTGTHPDRLAEEKRRGITIELGFADADLGDGRILSLVDVPGHERFVRHMVAGASGIDAVLLVVAADEGPKPQTHEHLAICQLLGVAQGVVALTKSDLVDRELVEVVGLEVREALAGTFLASAPVIAVSARSGAGLPELKDALRNLFTLVPARPDEGAIRLPVDRSFVLHGFGSVVTGTLSAGTLREGDELEVLPGRRRARVRGLQVHRRVVPQAAAGQRVAVNLQGIDCDQVPRGSTLAEPGAFRTTRRIWAEVTLLREASRLSRAGRGTIRFHQGTCERGARLRVLRAEGGTIQAEILLDEDTVLIPGDRFILRRPRPLDTVGGGRVVDAHPPLRTARRRAGRGGFEELDGGNAVRSRVLRAGRAGLSISELATSLGRPEAEILGEVEGAPGAELVRVGARVFSREAWDETARAVVQALEAFHAAEPLRPGMRREELRGRLARTWPQESWRALLEALEGGGEIRLAGDLLARAGHRVVLSDEDREIAERIDRAFLSGGFDPPDADSLIREMGGGRTRRILEVLVERGTLVRIVDGRLFHGESLAELRRRLSDHAKHSRTIDVAQFKQLAGVTRKNAIPLLEQMDAERVTRRTGNVREILTDTAA